MRSWNDPSEKMVQDSILYWLNYQSDVLGMQINTTGVYDPVRKHYRKPGRFVIKGTPDILVCLQVRGLGIFVGLEVKGPGGKQSDYQKLFQDRLQRKSGFYFIVKSIKDAEIALSLVRTHVAKVMDAAYPKSTGII